MVETVLYFCGIDLIDGGVTDDYPSGKDVTNEIEIPLISTVLPCFYKYSSAGVEFTGDSKSKRQLLFNF